MDQAFYIEKVLEKILLNKFTKERMRIKWILKVSFAKKGRKKN